MGDLGSVPEGNGYPFQYSCLENSMHRGAWQATVHGVAESDMTEQLTVTLSLLSQVLVQAHHFLTDFSFTCLYVIDPSPPSFLPWLVETNMFSLSIMQNKDSSLCFTLVYLINRFFLSFKKQAHQLISGTASLSRRHLLLCLACFCFVLFFVPLIVKEFFQIES